MEVQQKKPLKWWIWDKTHFRLYWPIYGYWFCIFLYVTRLVFVTFMMHRYELAFDAGHEGISLTSLLFLSIVFFIALIVKGVRYNRLGNKWLKKMYILHFTIILFSGTLLLAVAHLLFIFIFIIGHIIAYAN